MSDDIKKILARLDEALTPVSVKKGLNPQQRSVPQLPADFQPRKIRALGAATDPQHPMAGMAVGAAESAGEEIEERCWTGYRQQGMKKKGNRQVPNCVPTEDVNEGPNDDSQDNFTIDDIKRLEKIRDLETLRAQAKELIKGKPARRMKPEKIAFFYDRVDALNSPLAIIKMLYDLLLAGEGHRVIGSRNSMAANSYRARFGEQGVAEGIIKESGETYTWTAQFADGTTKQMNIATDEVPYAREAFAMKFPGRDIVRVTTDWKVAGGQHAHGAAAAMPDRRPTEPYGRDVDNPMVREQSLAEAVAEIEEDMLSKVKRDLAQYLDRLEKKVHKDRALKSKDDKTVDEDPTAVDTMTTPPPAPTQDPVMPESVAVKSIALEDGSVLEIHGDQLRGFEVRHGGRSLPTRFPNLDHAQMAVDLYRRRRGQDRDDSADYVSER